jgi:hypothetical protein
MLAMALRAKMIVRSAVVGYGMGVLLRYATDRRGQRTEIEP